VGGIAQASHEEQRACSRVDRTAVRQSRAGGQQRSRLGPPSLTEHCHRQATRRKGGNGRHRDQCARGGDEERPRGASLRGIGGVVLGEELLGIPDVRQDRDPSRAGNREEREVEGPRQGRRVLHVDAGQPPQLSGGKVAGQHRASSSARPCNDVQLDPSGERVAQLGDARGGSPEAAVKRIHGEEEHPRSFSHYGELPPGGPSAVEPTYHPCRSGPKRRSISSRTSSRRGISR